MSAVRVMGIVNVTPDSFSGDGTLGHGDHEAAVARGLAMAQAGADLIDVGGESTRPGYVPVPAEEELRRVLPVVGALADRGLTVSVDTSKAAVAAAALDAGARVVNDIWGLRHEPEIAEIAAAHGAGLVLMHNQRGIEYERDLVEEVVERLGESIDIALRAGVAREAIVVDPGIGFGKNAGQDMVLLRRIGELRRLGFPILVGASRKSFLGRLFGQEMDLRPWGTAAIVAACVLRGVDMVRVHDVAGMRAVVDVAEALR
ncbi:MAG TPA: dihydropteroate synthase [Candidatus Dormibacteraeota bacterium]|jgi:dihydropteroate synthase|nr:dihydropteroate synthase [Candidatus Dormibacteraeota bacterium]